MRKWVMGCAAVRRFVRLVFRPYGSCRVILTKIDAYNDDGAAYGCDTDHDFGCVLHSPCSASAA